jgi:hypothetical protein
LITFNPTGNGYQISLLSKGCLHLGKEYLSPLIRARFSHTHTRVMETLTAAFIVTAKRFPTSHRLRIGIGVFYFHTGASGGLQGPFMAWA